MPEFLDHARTQVLEGGAGLDQTGVLAALRVPDEELPELLQQLGSSNGVIGLAQVSGSLLLVCDPNLIAGVGGRER